MTTGLRTPEQAAHTLQTTTDDLAHRRRRGAAPGWIQLTRKTIRYHPADLDRDARRLPTEDTCGGSQR